MTIAQITTLIIAGPLGLICLAKLLVVLIFREERGFRFEHSAILVVCAVAIAISFLGIR